jgi:iron(III) transport system ATP-binding protein
MGGDHGDGDHGDGEPVMSGPGRRAPAPPRADAAPRAGEPRADAARAAGSTGAGPLSTGADLVVENLRKSFRTQPVFTGLSLSVAAGSLTAILGPSGSGKTTLLRVVAGFERADGGRVSIGGVTVDDSSGTYVAPEHRSIGYVPQEGALFPHLTVARNVAFGMSRTRRRAGEVTTLLDLVGMADMARRYPHQLSGGQQQRVALARALAVRPSLVLLDEPFSSLDASLRASTRSEIRALLRRAGATALLVTHDQDEALSWADHVAVIDGGRIGQFDRPQHLYSRPADPVLARFVGDANLVPGTMDRGEVVTPLGRLPVAGHRPPDGSRALVLVRPEQVMLTPAAATAPSATTPTPRQGAGGPVALVTAYEYFGHDAVVRLALTSESGGESPLDVVARVVGDAAWAPGTRAGVGVRGPVLVWRRDHAGDTRQPLAG